MSESNIYELLSQYAEGILVNETIESLNSLMQENPAAFLSELQQIITNESLPPIIIAHDFVFLKLSWLPFTNLGHTFLRCISKSLFKYLLF